MRLRRSDPTGPGFSRVRSGQGFSYRDETGKTVSDKELRQRFDSLAIPPAWVDVWISPFPHGHIQAVGTDAAGRRQYIYHPRWRERHDRVKFDRSLELAKSLPSARGVVTRALRSSDDMRSRTLAAAFRMLDTGSLRIGSERYAEANGSHGLSTLLCSHLSTQGDTVKLCFPAKSGQVWESEIADADLAEFVSGRVSRGGDKLLLSWSADGAEHSVSAPDINAYVRERTAGDFTAKDFRSLHGSVAAARSLAKHGAPANQRDRSRAIREAMEEAAQVLGNTPAIARKSYVDPRIIDRYDAGEMIDLSRRESAESQLCTLILGEG